MFHESGSHRRQGITRRGVLGISGVAVTAAIAGCGQVKREVIVQYVDQGVFESIHDLDISHPFGSGNLDAFEVKVAPQSSVFQILVIDGGGESETEVVVPPGRTDVRVDSRGYWSFPVDIIAITRGHEIIGHARVVEVAR